VNRRGARIVASVKVAVLRPQQPGTVSPASVVGVDLGVRRMATIATSEGVIATVDNPRVLERRLSELRYLNRQRGRRTPGSVRYRETVAKISQLHAEVASARRNAIHALTTRIAKTHGTIVIEDLNIEGMVHQKGVAGARSRRRQLSGAAMGEGRRQIRYKCTWYGATLIEADRFFPSSKMCHCCGHVQDIGWSEQWTCEVCTVVHQRDDNAAINLARLASLGSVGAPVKR